MAKKEAKYIDQKFLAIMRKAYWLNLSSFTISNHYF